MFFLDHKCAKVDVQTPSVLQPINTTVDCTQLSNRKRTLNTIDKYVTHTAAKYKYQIHVCEKCNHTYQGDHVFQMHQEQCEKKYCYVCKKLFGCLQKYKKHMHNCPPKRYSCTVCLKTYVRESDAEEHRRKHTGSFSTFTCSVCSCTLLTYTSLQLHMRQMHSTITI